MRYVCIYRQSIRSLTNVMIVVVLPSSFCSITFIWQSHLICQQHVLGRERKSAKVAMAHLPPRPIPAHTRAGLVGESIWLVYDILGY